MDPSRSDNILHGWYPHTTAPFICNAPMHKTSTVALAAAVNSAGGLGFITGGFDFTPTSSNLTTLSTDLASLRQQFSTPPTSPLPIGVGLLLSHPSTNSTNFLTAITPLLHSHKPSAVWLFAPSARDLTRSIIPALKHAGAGWDLKIWLQVGTVQAAREAVDDGADVIVAQGIDAGGHQWAQGAGIVSLVPEVADMLRSSPTSPKVPLLAAGGIADGRGVAAALALGADGVVMGTRFIASNEAASPPGIKDAVVAARDGGTSTVKSRLHDDINGSDFWSEIYDGRAIMGESYRDAMDGLSLEENRERCMAGTVERQIVWSGTGVGLIDKVVSAGEIVKGVQEEAKAILKGLQGYGEQL